MEGLRNLFSPAFVPYSDPKATIPLGAVLKHDWFELWYQPKIELKTLHLVGAEALARARHPTRGIVPPALFLPGAGGDAMNELTERVILTALGDWEDFAECGVPLRLAVNVPVSALVELPIPQMLREARPRAASWPGLTLEVTEEQIVHDLELAKDVADSLRELKCDLSVDDFGAGYSSFVRLKQLPFSELKIDRELCGELQRRPFQCRPMRDDCRVGAPVRTCHRGRGHRNDPRKPQTPIHWLSGRAGLSVCQTDAESAARRSLARAHERRCNALHRSRPT